MSNNPLDQASVGKGRLALKEHGRRVADVEAFILAFKPFPARPVDYRKRDTHNKGYLLEDRRGAAYAEIVLTRLFRRARWNALWIDSYKDEMWAGMPYESEKAELPKNQQRLYDEIREANGGKRGGCWDIWAWQGRRNLFVEAKMGRHDTIKANQIRWFRAATGRVRVPKTSFCVAEWYLEAGG